MHQIIERKDYFISHNTLTDCGEETAIVYGGKYYILLGNHVEMYKKAKTFKEAKEIFDNSDIERSFWSN